MGSGPSKNHETFAVAPAGVAGPTESPVSSDPHTTAALDHTLELIAGLPSQTDGPYHYGDLVSLVNQATDELQDAQLSESDAALYRKKIAAEAAAALHSLDVPTLQTLATEQGFQYPQLVGLHGNENPLTHWLNPAYPTETSSKSKIQAKAIERFELLASGAVTGINGVTLADLPNDAGSPNDEQSWNASPTEVAMAIAAVADAATNLKHQWGTDGGLSDLLAAERRLHTAACAEMGGDLAVAQDAASALVHKQIDSLPLAHRVSMINAAVQSAVDGGTMPERQGLWLHPTEQLALLRANTDQTVRAELEMKAQDRANDVRVLAAAIAGSDAVGTLPTAAAQIHEWVVAKQQTAKAAKSMLAWSSQVCPAGQQRLKVLGHEATVDMQTSLSTQWRQWAKAQPIGELRKAAAQLGMTDVDAATRAHVQNYIAGHWDSTLSKGAIQAAVSAAATAKQLTAGSGNGTAQHKAAAGAQKAPSPATSQAHVATLPESWAGKHAQLVAALQAHASLSREIPAPRPVSEIAELTFGKSRPAGVGGMHHKNFHEDSHGRLWLYKPDSTKGARAHAEAAAARLHHLAGVRTPPVYVQALEGKLGSLQPWLAGAQPLGQTPSSWSQTDVDALVRFHVLAWACSNHDGNPNNILRTPSGALTPIDHGQAWRYFGADRLAIDYDPNGSSYGQPPPAYLMAYKAALKGQLAQGVRIRPEAALPVIKAFEQMSDAAFRTELQPYAAAGVKANLPWAQRMRKGAQKRLGTVQVPQNQVATEFLTHAAARKASLRVDFAAFFSSLGFDNKALTQAA